MEDINKYIRTLRRDFSGEPLDKKNVAKEPHLQFEAWFIEAVKAEVHEPNAFLLSTVSETNRPSARVMLLRDYSAQGFSFFTNYKSKKSKEIFVNPYVCFTFFWPELARQVRIEGKLEKLDEKESESYFNSRPRLSRIGAWSSPQSQEIEDRQTLENIVAEFDKKYPTEDVPRPDFWGGYLLKPDYFEFWQGRESRLHDRVYYKLVNGAWKIGRLAP